MVAEIMATIGNLSMESDLYELMSELSVLNETIESLHQLNVATDALLESHKYAVNSFVDKIIVFYLRHNLSFVCLEDLMELFNSNRDAHDQLPTHKKQILKMFRDGKDMIEVFYFIRCVKCKKIVKKDSESMSKIMCCGVNLKKTETNFMVYMPLRKQISQSLDANWDSIQNFETSGDGSISDVHHGEILKGILKEYENSDTNILSLIVNVDGANKYNSNKLSLWPIQFAQNYLPPEIRFLPNNILVAGLLYTEEKFDFRDYMLPLIQELIDLNDDKIVKNVDGETYTFKPVVTSCVVDLPAKSKFQETTQFNGYDACTYCKHPGEQVMVTSKKSKKKKNTTDSKQEENQVKCVRYTEGSHSYPLRNEKETLEKMLVASSSSTKVVDGIKDVSCLVAIEHFNIVKGVSVDYMHCVLLGVQKGLTDFFCNSIYSNKMFYISNKKRTLLDSRILALKPNNELNRKPRSLKQRSDFKASEFRSMLLYYFPICLPGCVPNVYVKHVQLLSAAIYILLKAKITLQEIDEAEKMLLQFVQQHQKLFGKENMVMNPHLLKHLADCVRDLGPLWCQSAFAFERNNGVLLKKVNGTTDVLLQISSKYCLSKSVINHRIAKHGANDSEKVLLGRSVMITEKSLIVFNVESLKEVNLSNTALYVHKRIKLENMIYTSTLYTLPKKSIDYFVGLENGMIGKAKFYFESNNEKFVVMEEFEVIDEMDHFSRVQSVSRNIMAHVVKIQQKYIFLKVGIKQFITTTPNPYEKE